MRVLGPSWSLSQRSLSNRPRALPRCNGLTATLTGSAALGALLVYRPLPLLVIGVGLVLLGVSGMGGYWPLAVIFVWFGLMSTGLDSGLSLGGAHIGIAYLLLMAVVAVVSLRAWRPGRARGNGTRPAVSRGALALLGLPVLIWGSAGLLAGYEPAIVRTEAFLWIGALLALLAVSYSVETPSHLFGVAVVLLASGTVAAAKTVMVASLGILTSGIGPLHAYSTVNAQFGVQRVILVGGDTLMTLAVPVGFALLRVVRGPSRTLLTASLSICALGLVLTYTRTLLAAAAVGALVAWLTPLGGRWVRRGGNTWGIVAIVATWFLTSFTYGQSRFNAADAVIVRFVGGSASGSSSLSERLNEARVALGGHGITIITGRGLGSTFHSPFMAGQAATNWTHMGYVWLLMKGGLLLAVAMAAGLLWSVVAFRRAAQHQDGAAGGAMAGLGGAVAAFGALNLLVNRFASVEGMAFLGAILGCAAFARASTKGAEGVGPALERAWPR